MSELDRAAHRIRSLASHGLAATLAALVVLMIYGAGAQPVIALGGLALAAVVLTGLMLQPHRALAPIPVRRRLPPRR